MSEDHEAETTKETIEYWIDKREYRIRFTEETETHVKVVIEPREVSSEQ